MSEKPMNAVDVSSLDQQAIDASCTFKYFVYLVCSQNNARINPK